MGASHMEMVSAFKPEIEEETMASVDTKPEVAQQEVPIEEAEVMPVGEPKKKRRRDRNQRNMKNSTWENCGPQKKLAVARRGMSRRGKVTQHTKETDKKMSHRATVA
jgi:hypothetical protein